jgi:hypothetical protein
VDGESYALAAGLLPGPAAVIELLAGSLGGIAESAVTVGLAGPDARFGDGRRGGRRALAAGEPFEVNVGRAAVAYLAFAGATPQTLERGMQFPAAHLDLPEFSVQGPNVPRDPLWLQRATDSLGPSPAEFTFTISPDSDRTGTRTLPLPALRHPLSIESRVVAPGTVQWTPAGELIVLGPDGPCLGGFPVLGYLPEAERYALARLRPGDRFRLALD